MGFDLPGMNMNMNMFGAPVQGVGTIGTRGTQGAGGAGKTGFAPTRTPFQNDMDDFRASIAGWKGTPNLNRPGDPTLNFYS